MKWISFLIVLIIGLQSCDVEDFDPVVYDFYNVELDATQLPESASYFLFTTENYVEKITSGESIDMSYYYFGNTLCQLDLNGKRNCVDILEDGQNIEPQEPVLQDLIQLEYSGTIDSVTLYRYYPLEENYFKVVLPNQDSTLFLPALLNDDNRIILKTKDSIIIDTTFFVSDQPVIMTL